MPTSFNIDSSSFMENNLTSNINHIIGRIKELFRESHVYTLNQISKAINVVHIYPIEQIYYALSLFVDNRNMMLFDKYGRFGYLLNRDKYYEFQPIEITDTRSSVRDRSVPVEYKRGNIILELNERVDQKPQHRLSAATTTTKVKRSELSEFEPGLYTDIITEIRGLLNIIKMNHSIKSTEMDWYKNASRALEHLHIVHGFNEYEIIKYAIYHYLDSASYQVKRTIFENVVDERVFETDPEIETHLASYFRKFIIRSDRGYSEGIYITNKDNLQFIVRDIDDDVVSWKEGNETDFNKAISEKYTINKKALNDIVGYMIQFKDQDMSFYYKDIYLKRNKKGRRCDRSGGKAPIIDMLNRITRDGMYTEENTTSVMYSGSLCVVLEMLLRKYNESDKIYYLTPEQAILNKITDYSVASEN
jgi:hypothetical protein